MQKFGFMGIPFPKELGGQGCDTLTYAMCVEELSKGLRHDGVIVVGAHLARLRPDQKVRNPRADRKIPRPDGAG